MRYSSTAVDFPIATDVSQSIRASYTNFSSRTCVPVCARTRRDYKNDTIMNEEKNCYNCEHSDEWDNYGNGMCLLSRFKALTKSYSCCPYWK